MDQNRLFLAIAISVMILLGFQFLLPHQPTPTVAENTASTPSNLTTPPVTNPSFPGTQPIAVASPQDQKNVPRLPLNAPKVSGSLNLAGGRFDDLVLRDYHEEVSPESPLVRVLEPRADPQPYYVQFGWTADGVKVPDLNTVWTVPADAELTNAHPVTMSWDNGEGQVFQMTVSVDDNYMFTVQQTVQNNGSAPVAVRPWARIRRDYKPVTGGYYILHEGLLGVLNGQLQEQTYDKAKSESDKNAGGPSLDMKSTGGWLGITDKYWLTAIIPDQTTPVQADFRHLTENGADRYQADVMTENPLTAAPGAAASSTMHMFAGAKVVQLLDHYGDEYKIPDFWKAVDFGWFWFLTRPIFYALDWLYMSWAISASRS